MLVFKMQLWPFGNEERQRDLAEIRIWNKSAFPKDNGLSDYGYSIVEPQSKYSPGYDLKGDVLDWDRDQSALYLLNHILTVEGFNTYAGRDIEKD